MLCQQLFRRQAHGQQCKKRNIGADAIIAADEPHKDADDAAEARNGRKQQRHDIQAAQQPKAVAEARRPGPAGLPVPAAQQQDEQRQKAQHPHNAEVAVGVLVVHGAFIGGQDMEVAPQPVCKLLHAVPVG